MKINVFVNDVQVGSRAGCDVQVGEGSCGKVSTGTPFFYEGLPRDICEACMLQVGPGKQKLVFKSTHYDSSVERHSTSSSSTATVTTPAEQPPADVPLLPAPAFPSCPKCGDRAFAVVQHIAETKAYDWDAGAFKFKAAGDASIDQKTAYRCRSCGEEGLNDILAGWII